MTVHGEASLAAIPTLTAGAQSAAGLDLLWSAYLSAAQRASQDAQTWRMMRSAAGASGQTGFLYQAAYQSQNDADAAYQVWQAVYRLANPGARG